ncbi:sterol desaturase family protein [Halovulum sp. GXIMD14793]
MNADLRHRTGLTTPAPRAILPTMEHEALIRLGCTLGIFTIMALAEAWHPRRQRQQTRATRWVTNWGMVAISAALLRLLALAVPLLAVGAAIDAGRQGWGLFNLVSLPFAVELILSVLILDFLIWAQHLITHKVPFLWRLHRVHHADRDIDASTALRFHPLEIGFSMLVKIGAVYALGIDPVSVIVFEILLNGMAIFNHANLKLPQRVEAILRLLVVTPDMHRIHHSIDRIEHDTNYGFSLSLWDRLFGTYRAEPAKGHDEMTTGLTWQDARPSRLAWSLLLPFRRRD